VRLHREILDAPDGMEVDHVNGYTNDNTRRNLRLCVKAQNQGNSKMQTREKSAPFKGVSFHKKNRTWIAKIGKPRIYLGSFATAFEAAVAYNAAAKSRWGEFARLNSL